MTAEELMELLESKDFQGKVEIQKRRSKDQAISHKDLLKLLDRSHLWRQWEEKKKQRGQSRKTNFLVQNQNREYRWVSL